MRQLKQDRTQASNCNNAQGSHGGDEVASMRQAKREAEMQARLVRLCQGQGDLWYLLYGQELLQPVVKMCTVCPVAPSARTGVTLTRSCPPTSPPVIVYWRVCTTRTSAVPLASHACIQGRAPSIIASISTPHSLPRTRAPLSVSHAPDWVNFENHSRTRKPKSRISPVQPREFHGSCWDPSRADSYQYAAPGTI
jgi:hypothetical protein